MFRIKLCGITNPSDARLAAEAGSDAIGLNFYPLSPRCVDLGTAHQIVQALPDEFTTVGVFVNSPSNEVRTIADRLRLDIIQLHGDEPPEYLLDLSGYTVVRAMRFDQDLAAAAEYLQRCRSLGCQPAAVLIDAHRRGQYGGTGTTIEWGVLVKELPRLEATTVLLAGGLNARNVADAIAAVRPDGVDTASGVELSPGHKSEAQMRAFVHAARHAFEQAQAR